MTTWMICDDSDNEISSGFGCSEDAIASAKRRAADSATTYYVSSTDTEDLTAYAVTPDQRVILERREHDC